MAETSDTSDDSGITGEAGFERLVGEAAAEEREQQERLTEAEKQKQRIMRERSAIDDATPVEIDVDGYSIVFDPLPKKARVWMENSSFEFLGFDEDELRDHPEKGKQFRDVASRTVDILATSAQAAAYDADFWREWFALEERMGVISDILDAQDEQAGN